MTDVVPETMQDYENTSIEALLREPVNIQVLHESVISLVVKADRPTFRRHEFWVKWTMQRQKEVFQVYNFNLTYRKNSGDLAKIQFYAVPLGAYFKPKRQTQTRQAILQEYADEILDAYRRVLPSGTIKSQSINETAAQNL